MKFEDLALSYGEDFVKCVDDYNKKNNNHLSEYEAVRWYYYKMKFNDINGMDICSFARNMFFCSTKNKMWFSNDEHSKDRAMFIPDSYRADTKGKKITIIYDFKKIYLDYADKSLLNINYVETSFLYADSINDGRQLDDFTNKLYPACLCNFNIEKRTISEKEHIINTGWKMVDLDDYSFDKMPMVIVRAKSLKSIDHNLKEIVNSFNKFLNQAHDSVFDILSTCELGWHVLIYESAKMVSKAKNEGCFDTLGCYVWGTNQNELEIDMYNREYRYICVFTKAIEDYVTELIRKNSDILDENRSDEYCNMVTMSVMAHEMFHAYQDFKVNFQNSKREHDLIETYAEYFGLIFIKDILKENELFEAMIRDWESYDGNDEDLLEYKNALTFFGDIREDASKKTFAKFLNEWEMNNKIQSYTELVI